MKHAPAPTTRPPRERLHPWQAALLAVAVVFHLSLLASWRLGFWNRFTFDATSTRGDRGWDLFALYQAGRNVLDGLSAYESDNEKIHIVVPRHTPFRYLPVSAYTVGVALNAVDPLWAFRLWVAFLEATLLTCACLSSRLGRWASERALFAGMWLVFTPYYLELYLGQFSLVQAAFILLMMLAWESGQRGWWVDAPWTASLLWKQNTGLFLPLMVRLRRWRGLAVAAAAVVVTSAPYFARHPEALRAFLANFRSGPPSAQLGNLGVRQLLYSVTSALWPTWTPETHSMVQMTWVALVVAVTLWLTLRPVSPDVPMLLCLWTATYFLVYHHVWEHHYVLLLPVYVLLYRRTGSAWVLALYALVAVWTPYRLVDPEGLAAYHMPMRWEPLESAWLDVTYHASKALPTLALWVYLSELIRRRTHQDDPLPCPGDQEAPAVCAG